MTEIVLRYKCPFTGEPILEGSVSAIRTLNGETYCAACGETHPLTICPRESIIVGGKR